MSEFRAGDGEATRGVRTGPPTATARATVPPPPRTVPVETQPVAVPPLWRRVLRWAFRGALAVAAVFALLIVAYRFINPPQSALMLLQRAGGTRITHTWVPLERISPQLVRAVVMSEDAGFCRHHGVDWSELRDAIERAGDGITRGGSTISMQVAKNLFLWPSKSYVRKAIEIPLTLGMELAWPKARMLEIYLNIAEWGPGVFGAEAAARYHFKKSASQLTEQEAALLAVSLPAPLVREPGQPSELLSRMSQTIVGRMRNITRHTVCVLGEQKPATSAVRR